MTERIKQPDTLRFRRSHEGSLFLRGIRDHLRGRAIRNVRFRCHGEGITTTLSLDNGESYAFEDGELTLETLRAQFGGLFRELDRREREDCP